MSRTIIVFTPAGIAITYLPDLLTLIRRVTIFFPVFVCIRTIDEEVFRTLMVTIRVMGAVRVAVVVAEMVGAALLLVATIDVPALLIGETPGSVVAVSVMVSENSTVRPVVSTNCTHTVRSALDSFEGSSAQSSADAAPNTRAWLKSA